MHVADGLCRVQTQSVSIFSSMGTDKTPMTNSLLLQAQEAAARPKFHAQATIRWHNLEAGLEAPLNSDVDELHSLWG